jgi:hypothetical protein
VTISVITNVGLQCGSAAPQSLSQPPRHFSQTDALPFLRQVAQPHPPRSERDAAKRHVAHSHGQGHLSPSAFGNARFVGLNVMTTSCFLCQQAAAERERERGHCDGTYPYLSYERKIRYIVIVQKSPFHSYTTGMDRRIVLRLLRIEEEMYPLLVRNQ